MRPVLGLEPATGVPVVAARLHPAGHERLVGALHQLQAATNDPGSQPLAEVADDGAEDDATSSR